MANNWTEICAKCMEGDIEPHYCEYYGEPNGCNSPMYGEHPPALNTVAMHSCLLKILAEMTDLGGMQVGRRAHFSPDAIADEIRQALAEPPRNCDVGTAEEQLKRLHNTICNTTKACPDPDWSCAKCFAVWSQTPYEEGGAK